MRKSIKLVVLLASIGVMSSAYADRSDYPKGAAGAKATGSDAASKASSKTGASSATDDQVLVGGNGSSPAAQSTSNQGSASLKQENTSDEDLD